MAVIKMEIKTKSYTITLLSDIHKEQSGFEKTEYFMQIELNKDI